MWRYYTAIIVALFECASLLWSANAAASHDLFTTEKFLASGPFAATSEVCPKDRIQRKLTLADVVELALCNNPQTRALWASSRAQAAQLGTTMSSYLPTLSGPISVSGTRSTVAGVTTDSRQKSIGLTVSYLLYDFGGRAAGVENAKQLLVAANASRDETLQTVFLTAIQSYYTLLSARASMQSFTAAEAAARESLNAAQARYQAGTGIPADRLQAQTALSQAVLNRIRAEGEAVNAQGSLASIMGFDATQPFELAQVPEITPDPVVEQDIGKLIEQARHSRPDLIAAEAQIKAAEAQVRATNANGLPSFTLNGSAVKLQSSANASAGYSQSLTLAVSVPWFSGYRDTYQNRIAQAQLEGKVADRDRVANQIALEVWNAYQVLLTNSQALRAADDLLASATQSEKVVSGRYKAGLGSILDVLSAQSALANAQQQRVTALYHFQASRFTLTQAIGQLDLTLLGTKN